MDESDLHHDHGTAQTRIVPSPLVVSSRVLSGVKVMA
jgi:hypothetical protein